MVKDACSATGENRRGLNTSGLGSHLVSCHVENDVSGEHVRDEVRYPHPSVVKRSGNPESPMEIQAR